MINVTLDKDNYHEVISKAIKVIYKEKFLSELNEYILEDIEIVKSKAYLDMIDELKKLEQYGPTTLDLLSFCDHDGIANILIKEYYDNHLLISVKGNMNTIDILKSKFDLRYDGKLKLLYDIFNDYMDIRCVYISDDSISIPIKEIRKALYSYD